MNETLEFLVRHGAAVLFAAVFVEQMGLPLPAAPWLLAAGALAGTGKMNWFVALSAAVIGSVLADVIWFYLGRHGGHRVLSLLCRISLEPDSCVRRTQDLFTRYGMRGVIGAKFIPDRNERWSQQPASCGVKANPRCPYCKVDDLSILNARIPGRKVLLTTLLGSILLAFLERTV